jgi:hypothetical protein
MLFACHRSVVGMACLVSKTVNEHSSTTSPLRMFASQHRCSDLASPNVTRSRSGIVSDGSEAVVEC